jgi:uncharacterized membrane protein YkvA (DUF1232 family)
MSWGSEGEMKVRQRGPSLLHQIRVDVHAAWLAVRDPRTSWPARIVGFIVTAYALSPLDLIPDFIPVLGLVDDVIIIPIGLWIFLKMLPPGLFEECREIAEAASERPRSRAGVLIVMAIWFVAAAAVIQLLRSAYA